MIDNVEGTAVGFGSLPMWRSPKGSGLGPFLCGKTLQEGEEFFADLQQETPSESTFRTNPTTASSASRLSMAWIWQLLRGEFFVACKDHRNLRKGELNIYCIECNKCMCFHCITPPESSPHSSHRLLQIRRYVYQNVVRIRDIADLFDCSDVQPFTVNSAKVVLLNPRKHRKSITLTVCEACRQFLQGPYKYCSISCKVLEGGEESRSRDSNTSLLYNSLPQVSDSSKDKYSLMQQRKSSSPQPKMHRRKAFPHRSPFF